MGRRRDGKSIERVAVVLGKHSKYDDGSNEGQEDETAENANDPVFGEISCDHSQLFVGVLEILLYVCHVLSNLPQHLFLPAELCDGVHCDLLCSLNILQLSLQRLDDLLLHSDTLLYELLRLVLLSIGKYNVVFRV